MKHDTDAFYRKIENTGLTEAFSNISAIASDMLGSFLEDIIDTAESYINKPVCRIRYEKEEDQERYIFEIQNTDEEEFSFMCSFQVMNDQINYQALTQIRELIRQGYTICFG